MRSRPKSASGVAPIAFVTTGTIQQRTSSAISSRRVRSGKMIAAVAGALVATSFVSPTPARAVTTTLGSTGTAAANPWGTGLWNDATADSPNSNTSTYTTTDVTDAGTMTNPTLNSYMVSGLKLFAPTFGGSTASSNFTGGALTLLNSSTMSLTTGSAGTVTYTYNFKNLSSGQISMSDSTIAIANNDNTTIQFNGGLALSDTGTNVNTISESSAAFGQTLNLSGLISGSGP
jgi:hypothetical protein